MMIIYIFKFINIVEGFPYYTNINNNKHLYNMI